LSLVYLGLGANVGDREHNLRLAETGLVQRGAHLLRASKVIETKPWGVTDQPDFLNQVLEVEWAGGPYALLAAVQASEAAVGRTATYRWGPREIDIDILLFGDLVISEPRLSVPHPRMWQREFVLSSLRELRPDLAPASLLS
jgi:2-amino-4-hydroxy-6-hydroxymethyldihydropteridine diphosphokinase